MRIKGEEGKLMIQQERACTNLPKAIVLDFKEHKKKRPFFTKSATIHVGSPIYHTYVVLKNIVFLDKQILFLKSEEDPKTILFVEAVIEYGQLKAISKVPEEYMADLIGLFEG